MQKFWGEEHGPLSVLGKSRDDEIGQLEYMLYFVRQMIFHFAAVEHWEKNGASLLHCIIITLM